MLLVFEAIALIPLILIIYYRCYAFRYWQRRNVPSVPPSIPWGNYINLIQRKMHFGERLTEIYNEMKQRGHQYAGLYLFTRPCFLPINPKFIRCILTKDFQYFSHRNLYHNEKDDPISGHLLSVNGEQWRNLRMKLSPTFTSGKIKSMFRTFLDCGTLLERLLDESWRNGDAVNLRDLFTFFTREVIGTCAFGLDHNRQNKEEFRKYSRRVLYFSVPRFIVMFLGSIFPKTCRFFGFRQVDKVVGDFFMKTVRDTVQEREENNIVRQDFLQLLINIKNRKEFTMEEVAAQCFIFFMAGYETSSSTMTFTLYELALNPLICQRVQEEIGSVLDRYDGQITYEAIIEMKYLNQVIEETLRKYSPAYFVTRICTKDYNLPDTDIVIEKGTQILIPMKGIHHDSEYYPDPEKFMPERFNDENKKNRNPYTYLPFGEGPRNCIGLRFGMLETKVALVIALRKYRFSVNSRTDLPLRMDPQAMLLEPVGGIWLDIEKIQE